MPCRASRFACKSFWRSDAMCGGDVEAGSIVDEEWLLDLERKNFMELLATQETRDRVEYMLKNGKPLRDAERFHAKLESLS
jgi:hypothetical protein